MATLTGTTTINLGHVTREQVSVENNILSAALIGRSTENNIALNFGGKTRRIIIEGIWSGNAATLRGYINTVNSWVNDTVGVSIQSPRILTLTLDPNDGPYNVLCNTFRYTYSTESPNKVVYTMELLQGDATGGLI